MSEVATSYARVEAKPMPRWRRPLPWVLAWAVYTLIVLGWLGYQSAFLASLCLAPR